MGCGHSVSKQQKVEYLKLTPFCLHLSAEELEEFASIFRVL